MTMKIQRLTTQDSAFQEKLLSALAFDASEDAAIDQAVVKILDAVKKSGDPAVLEYTRQFDRLNVETVAALEIPKEELKAAFAQLPKEQSVALEAAADRVRFYHERQKKEIGSDGFSYTEADGTVLGQRVTPLDRVGIYVPGGKAAYPSSVLMNAIPAKVAGVKEIIMVVPTPGGVHNELVFAAAAIAGVDRVFTIGGAQAVAALAYGTKTIPAVDKIVGPGNAYVAAAKRRVFGTVGIDMIAGPSEILIVCDGSVNPDWIAMDLFSQAEHDELAQSILVCPELEYIDQVMASIEKLLPTMPRRDVIYTSLTQRGVMIHVKDQEEACAVANIIAAEHLEIAVQNPEVWMERIHHAGAIFLGQFSSESLGDYCAGPNHVLPTSRTARFSSPLGVYDFQKRSSVMHISKQGAQTLGKIAVELAKGEGLPAHAQSAQFRLE